MAVGGRTFTADDIVEKSPNDKRLYRYIQLPNGLCALLVHDPDIYPDGLPEHSGNSEDEEDEEAEDSEEGEEESDETDDEEETEVRDKGSKGASQKKAAAAMCVTTGSFSDPYDAQGLAHFLGVQGLSSSCYFGGLKGAFIPGVQGLSSSCYFGGLKGAWNEGLKSKNMLQ